MKPSSERVLELAARIAKMRKELETAEGHLDRLVNEFAPRATKRAPKRSMKRRGGTRVGTIIEGSVASRCLRVIMENADRFLATKDVAHMAVAYESQTAGALHRLAKTGKIKKVAMAKWALPDWFGITDPDGCLAMVAGPYHGQSRQCKNDPETGGRCRLHLVVDDVVPPPVEVSP